MSATGIGLFVIAAFLSARVETDVQVFAKANGKVNAIADSKQDEDTFDGPLLIGKVRELKADAKGAEESQCTTYGRNSASQGAASVAVFQRAGSVEIQLGTTAITSGGHFRRCKACFADQCVGVQKKDTEAYSSADLQAEVELQLPPNLDERNYWLNVKHVLRGSGAIRTLELVGEKGEALPLGSTDRRLVLAGPGKPIIVRAKLSGSSRDSGGCCRDSQQGTFFATIDLEPAPLPVPIATSRTSEDGLTGVGVLIEVGLRGEPSPVCAATLVGKRTALTAAHCILAFAREKRASRLYFVSGKDIGRELGRANPVVDFAVPSDAFFGGYSYRVQGAPSKEREDDIALVYLESEVAQPILSLNPGPPRIEEIPSAAVISFALPGTDAIQSAAKLVRVSSPTKVLYTGDRTVTYTSDSGCGAIGGSPLLQVGAGGASVIGLVGETPAKCGATEVASRIDSYLPWLRERIR